MPLGTGDYDVVIADQANRKVWQSGTNALQSVSWGREYSETSTCVLGITANPAVANQIEPWVHKVSVYRNGHLVWHGMTRQVRAKRSQLTITAYDASVYWGYRRVGQPRHYFNKDAVTVAQDLVTDAMGMDDPLQVLDGLAVTQSFLWCTMDVAVATTLVKDAMGDLEKLGFAWTVSAGRVILGPLPAQRTLTQLTDDHMSAEIEVVKEGAEVTNDVLVMGKGVLGYWADRTTPVGVLQSIQKADALVHAEDCVNQAKRVVTASQYPPRQLTFPSAAKLLPNAPMRMNELIPGVLVPISSRQTGVVVGSTMAVKKVQVDVDEGGEAVSVTFMEPPVTTNASLLPPPGQEDYNSPYDQEQKAKETPSGTDTSASTDTGVGPA